MDVLKLCSIYCKLIKRAEEEFQIVKNFGPVMKRYETLKSVHLRPGPAGTQGQIFYVEEDPNLVIKFTLDKSEAKNMSIIKKIQNNEPTKYSEGFSQKELQAIENSIIKVYGVYTINNAYNSGIVYVIEQERGKNLPFPLAKRLLSMIGGNASKQSNDAFDAISNRLSSQSAIEELSATMAESLIDGKEVVISPEDIDVSSLGEVLKLIRDKIDDGFKDFRPSNMVTTKSKTDGKYRIKLIDLGQSGAGDWNPNKELAHIGQK